MLMPKLALLGRANLHSSARSAFVQELSEEIEQIRSNGTFRLEQMVADPHSVEIKIDDKSLLNFCANSYLGLGAHPQIVQAAKESVQRYGAGLSRQLRLVSDEHRRLERTIARFHRRPDAVLYPNCFDANLGLFEAITTAKDAILSDELNHASIIDGIRLSRAKRLRYKHADIAELERRLIESKSARRRIIVTDGVFSMDGDEAPLREICALADRHEAIVAVDDCHATGFIGPTGRGTEEACGLLGRVDVLNSSLSKAVGGAMGGYTTGPAELVAVVRQRSRPYLFSNSSAPAVVGAALKAFELLSSADNPFAGQLRTNVAHFRGEIRRVGFQVLGSPTHPICPIQVGDASLAQQFARAMAEHGIYVIGLFYPVVPKDSARIRVQISAAHSSAQIEQCVDAFKKIGAQMGLLQ